MKEKHTLIFSYLAFLIPFFQIQNCTAQCVYIDPNISVPSPCDPKSGYNLIVSDECNVFNASLWDKSSPGDDLPGYGDPLLCTYLGSENAPKNETNVSAAGGTYNLRVRQGEEQNVCSHSSAEIKTFNNVSEGNTFRSWKVFKDSYVEVRYRMPSCKGIGSAFWLYSVLPGKFYEIDIHEQDPAKPDQVNSNIHFGPGYDHETTYPVDTKFCSLNG
ncbi:MAG: family 16 glycosylhydrolase, partial [Phycisphaerae bacterium]|nr:family 16 glycosylhydrolase [Saprospiraceae bacterium]